MSDDDLEDLERKLTEGMEVGRYVIGALLDVAQEHGALAAYKATGDLTGDQAKHALALLICFERQRIADIVKMSGYNPN